MKVSEVIQDKDEAELPQLMQKILDQSRPCIMTAARIGDLISSGDSISLVQGNAGEVIAMIASTIMMAADQMGITTEELAAHVVMALHEIGELGVEEPERRLS